MTELESFEELKYRIVRSETETIYYNSANQIHRDNDLPAVVWADGSQEWYVNGRRHRDNGLPAFINPDGTQFWYVNGVRHRDNDMPAVIWAAFGQEWWVNGEFVK